MPHGVHVPRATLNLKKSKKLRGAKSGGSPRLTQDQFKPVTIAAKSPDHPVRKKSAVRTLFFYKARQSQNILMTPKK